MPRLPLASVPLSGPSVLIPLLVLSAGQIQMSLAPQCDTTHDRLSWLFVVLENIAPSRPNPITV